MNKAASLDAYREPQRETEDFERKEFGGHRYNYFDISSFQIKPTELDVALNQVKERTFSESEYDDLLTRYLKQITVSERYEKLIEEMDTNVSSVLTKMTLAFSAVIILTALLFGKLF